MRLVRAIVLFVLTAPTVFVLLLVLLGEFISPGRGFLPSQRRELVIDFAATHEEDGVDVWAIDRIEVVPEASDFDPPETGVRLRVRESTMGRWDPGRLTAWRMRSWSITDIADARGDLRGDTPPRVHWSPAELALLDAVADTLETSVMVDAEIWSLWPTGSFADVRRSEPHHWFASSRGTNPLPWAVILVLSLIGGLGGARIGWRGRWWRSDPPSARWSPERRPGTGRAHEIP